MAIFHVSTSTPTKAEVLAAWLPEQWWAPRGPSSIELLGSFHFDDPEGQVGMETHIVRVGASLLQVPLTYRDHALDDVTAIATLQHSVLGKRWVYDGFTDPRYRLVIAGVALTGQGTALGWAHHEGRWYTAPSVIEVRHHGPRTVTPVAVDGLEVSEDRGDQVVLRRGRLEVTVVRLLAEASTPPQGLVATWEGQAVAMQLASTRRRDD